MFFIALRAKIESQNGNNSRIVIKAEIKDDVEKKIPN